MTKDQVTLKDVEAASKRLAGVVHKTPLESSHIFSEMAGYEVLLKLENMQQIRGLTFYSAAEHSARNWQMGHSADIHRSCISKRWIR